MFRCILVPLDGSLRAERAIPVAERLVRASQGMLILLRMANAAPAYKQEDPRSPLYQTAIQNELDEAQHYLTTIASSSKLTGLPLTIVAPQGSVISKIQAAVQMYGVDLVVLCKPNVPRCTHPLLSVFAEQLLSYLSLPVLFVPAQGPITPGSSPRQGEPTRFLVGFEGPQPAPYLIQSAVALQTSLADKGSGYLHFAPLSAIVSSVVRTSARQQGTTQHREQPSYGGGTAIALKEAQTDEGLEEGEKSSDVFILGTSTLDNRISSWLELHKCLQLLVPPPVKK